MRLGKVKSRFFPVMLAVSISLSALSVVSYRTQAVSFLFGAAGVVATPVQKAALTLADGVRELAGYFADVRDLQNENTLLKEENARLETENHKAAVIKEENDWLYQFLDLKRERTELSFVNAKIVSHDVGFIQTFTLDKGSFNGVAVNMPVITEHGLLGLVTEVGYTSCRGISLINHNMSVGVYMERTMTPAILTGSFELYEKGLCKVVNLPTDTDVMVGDLVYTSGYGSIYPKDIAVGTVVGVEPDETNYTITAIVEPASDVSLADFVMIVTDNTTTYE